jgi:hypothetical protein
MTIEEQKIEFVKEFLKLKVREVISRLEKLLSKEINTLMKKYLSL